MEFIDMEHTAKNLCVRAVARDRTDRLDIGVALSERRSYQQMKKELGLHSSLLEDLLISQSQSVS